MITLGGKQKFYKQLFYIKTHTKFPSLSFLSHIQEENFICTLNFRKFFYKNNFPYDIWGNNLDVFSGCI